MTERVVHMPGPWRAIINDPDRCCVLDRHLDEVCRLDRLDRPHTSADQVHRNAHLIAAAPDLLAALRALVEKIEAGNGRFIGTKDTLYNARAAIEAAEVTR